MRKLYHILSLASLLLGLAACDKEREIDSALLTTEDYCLEVNGKMVQSFSDPACQKGFNASKGQFRVGDDTMTEYYIVECDKVPSSKDETLTVNLAWTLGSTVQTRSGLKMKVSQIGDDGRIWLWSSRDAVAAIVAKP